MEDQSLKPIRCKAAVCRAASEPLIVEEIVVDPPKAYEIRIKIICTSLCHTDVTLWHKVDPAFPRILGHEAYGVVESVGENVEGFAAGDTVVPTFMGQCDSCASCAAEWTNQCTAVPFTMGPGMRRDGTTRFWDGEGKPLSDTVAVTSFSQYTVVDVNQVVKVDPAVPPKIACLLGCCGGTGEPEIRRYIELAWGRSSMEVGQSATRFVGGCLRAGIRRIGGKEFGVTDFVNPSQLGDKSVSEVINAMTDGGADYSFECIGISSVMTEAGRGKTIILGVEKDSQPLCLPSFEFLFGKCVMGSLFGGAKPKTDIPILAEKCMNKELELEKLVTHEVGLTEINTAFDLLLQGKSLRCIIWMDK
uniref:Alcohol dehydrogenase-like N-terminal domain-containing protein n=1 Tax=Oryza barthii TaxID=65489 RepID=A0A0D3FEU2_9ORYZ